MNLPPAELMVAINDITNINIFVDKTSWLKFESVKDKLFFESMQIYWIYIFTWTMYNYCKKMMIILQKNDNNK